MLTSLVAGFLLILVAAIMNGAYAIPMKFMPRWKWENIWLLWTVLSLWALPLALACATVPHPIAVYSQTPWTSLAWMAVMGVMWGAGVLLIGMAFPLVGVAVGAAVALGCAAAMGTLLPLLRADAPPLAAHTGALISLGVAAVLVGVGVCGFAGRARERQQGTGAQVAGQSLRGFLYASIGGTLTAALNLAFVSGATILTSLAEQHPTTQAASIAVWIPVLWAGGIPGVLYTVGCLAKGRSAALYRAKNSGAYWPLVGLMSVLWLGSVVLYGNGVAKIGSLGPIVGWPAFMSGAVIFSAAWGALFGEWRNSGRTAKVAMTAGVVCLMAAILILGKAGH
jgi:L-rhamnose-H+ transport protein